jgi:hypothetical protein
LEAVVVEEPTEEALEEAEEIVTRIPISVADSGMAEGESPGAAEEWPFESEWDQSGENDRED